MNSQYICDLQSSFLSYFVENIVHFITKFNLYNNWYHWSLYNRNNQEKSTILQWIWLGSQIYEKIMQWIMHELQCICICILYVYLYVYVYLCPGAVAKWLRWLTSVAWLLSGVIGLSQWHIPGGCGFESHWGHGC